MKFIEAQLESVIIAQSSNLTAIPGLGTTVLSLPLNTPSYAPFDFSCT